MRKPSVGIIFLTVFIDLIGFGIVIPLLSIYGKAFHATSLELGAIAAVFSVTQFIFGPILGRLSDRVGRRPVLLLSTAGAAISYVIFALGSGLEGRSALLVIFLSRAFAGLCGANITVAQAYIADITPPADRSRKMGLIGMAFGLGFIFGPLICVLARYLFGMMGPRIGMMGPGLVAAGFCAANFLLAFSILPESRQPGSREQVPRRPHLNQWAHTLTLPKVGLLIDIFFLATFCFACFETTIGLLICQKFSIAVESDRATKLQGYLFAYAGIIGAVVQGGLIGRLVRALGEPRLIAASLVLVAISLAGLPFADHWPAILVLLAVLSIGSGLTRPPVFGMISNLTSANEQGVTIGVAQSMGALARILGPLVVFPLFYLDPKIPYVLCGSLSFLTAIFAWLRLSKGYESLALAAAAAKETSSA
jgi:MFS transporter, DHA1 family, tetracycline resistance protein